MEGIKFKTIRKIYFRLLSKNIPPQQCKASETDS